MLRKKVKQMMYEYLNAQGVDVALLVSVEDSSVAYMCDLVQLAKLSRQIEEIIQSKVCHQCFTYHFFLQLYSAYSTI